MTAGAARGLVRDAWLEHRLGRAAWRLELDPMHPGNVGATLRDLGGEQFVYARVGTDEVAVVDQLEDQGFRVVDTAITLGLPSLSALPSPGPKVRFAVGDDEQAVRHLAGRAFSGSRFHLDPRIGAELADKVKSDWAGGFFSGARGDWMVVAGPTASPSAFLQLLRRDDCLVIDLVAVEEESRGRGLMGEMVGFAAHFCEGVTHSEVGTQVANVVSLRAYERLGFRVLRTQYVLHWHRS